ncbi:MAG: insulinase family protein [Tidjanibacter sp.]|nr:insulinase family protein [Tidjanibacter sp.]
MKRYAICSVLTVLTAMLLSCGHKYDYTTVEGDPMKTKIYTLDNGLKIFMAVNRETPRIQANIAVRVGGKNDPAETTGLAHYFEHLMFKGTENFGTSDYAAEKPLLDQIESLFESYRSTADQKERKAIYHQIDSVSYEASKLSIPNEYDKLMSAIGAQGTNAYTSYDVTCYVEDIPANQVDNWARIQGDRFANAVIRGFHTELETVYEEKNMSLTRDSRKVSEQMLAALFPEHPYGLQTVLGTQEHLKNPSITNIKNYYNNWYVPNNMAVCISGDFDPDHVVEVIEKYFGGLKPNENLNRIEVSPVAPLTENRIRNVYGLESENVTVAWPLGGPKTEDYLYGQLASGILNNGQAGLFDLDLSQKQRVLSVYGGTMSLADYGCLMAQGRPKTGQSLDEVKALMLAEVDKLCRGEWDEALLTATVNNFKLNIQNTIDTNDGRAEMLVDAFVNDVAWADQVAMLNQLSEITKDELVAWAASEFNTAACVVVYKHQGKDQNEKKIEKPAITPIATNRDTVSPFLAEIQKAAAEAKPIEPVYVNFERDLSHLKANNIEVLYKENPSNDLFKLEYVFERGSYQNKALPIAFDYLEYLGTSTKSAEEIAAEFYTLACSVNYRTEGNRTYISIVGLNESMSKAVALVEEILTDSRPDEQILANLKANNLRQRENSKNSQRSNFSVLRRYATYGPDYVTNTVLNNNKLAALTSDELLGAVAELIGTEHRILYYGPASQKAVCAAIEQNHTKGAVNPAPAKVVYPMQPTPKNSVLLAQYDAKQLYYTQYSNRGEEFDTANDAELMLYNTYFGGGMNGIVFQEMREARGLAYSASAYIEEPYEREDPYTFTAFIATQNDKMAQAIDAFDEIINRMPESEAAFAIAKESVLSNIRTKRVIKSAVLDSYLAAEDLGIDFDRNKAIFDKVQNMTLADIEATQQKWVKDRPYTYCILGDLKDLDMNKLTSLGEMSVLSQEKIFGY